MPNIGLLPAAQIVVGLGLAGYAVVLIVERLRKIHWRWPRWPSNDLRVLVDVAARFRDAGDAEAVKACQTVIDHLLAPKTPTP